MIPAHTNDPYPRDPHVWTDGSVVEGSVPTAIRITQRDEIKSVEEGFLYKRRTAVCQMLLVTQNDGRC